MSFTLLESLIAVIVHTVLVILLIASLISIIIAGNLRVLALPVKVIFNLPTPDPIVAEVMVTHVVEVAVLVGVVWVIV